MSKYMDFYLLLQILVNILFVYCQKFIDQVKKSGTEVAKTTSKRARATGSFIVNKITECRICRKIYNFLKKI